MWSTGLIHPHMGTFKRIVGGESGEISWVHCCNGKVKCKSWQAFLGLLSPILVLPPCPPSHRAQERTVARHFSAKGCRPDINFWWTTLMPFRLKPRSYKRRSTTRATKQHLLTRHGATFAHLYNTRGVPNGSISRQGVWGPQQGLGRDT